MSYTQDAFNLARQFEKEQQAMNSIQLHAIKSRLEFRILEVQDKINELEGIESVEIDVIGFDNSVDFPLDRARHELNHLLFILNGTTPTEETDPNL